MNALKGTAAVVLAMSLAIGVSGCKKKQTVEYNSPEQAAKGLKQSFDAAPPDAKSAADVAAQALQEHNIEKAWTAVQVLQTQTNLTFRQGMALVATRDMMAQQIAEAARQGDPNAKRFMRMMGQGRHP